MGQSEKAAAYQTLKELGVEFTKHYRDYTTAELEAAVVRINEAQAEQAAQNEALADYVDPDQNFDLPEPEPQPVGLSPLDNALNQQRAAQQEPVPTAQPPLPPRPQPTAPTAARDHNELPGQRLNTHTEDEPIRVDPDTGFIWFQEEVAKPASPRPRGRRVLKYMDTGSKTVQIKQGEFTESFEVSGDAPPQAAEVRITMPSYQVGIYKDPRLPFKIHVYNGNKGFDLFEVNTYFGGSELVPEECKRIYVSNVLCYDIRTVVRAIQSEYRRLQLQGRV